MLRGVNVGGQKQLRMETLRAIYTTLGFKYVRSYLQSGNIVFESTEQDEAALARLIEAGIEKTCAYPVPVFIRQANEFKSILNSNPFLNERNENPARLHVTFLYQPVAESAWAALIPPAGIPDEFARGRGAIYLFCPDGYGKTRLSNSFFERRLKMPVTTRNWNTVNALYRMVTGD